VDSRRLWRRLPFEGSVGQLIFAQGDDAVVAEQGDGGAREARPDPAKVHSNSHSKKQAVPVAVTSREVTAQRSTVLPAPSQVSIHRAILSTPV
jgi:hypothetical protein